MVTYRHIHHLLISIETRLERIESVLDGSAPFPGSWIDAQTICKQLNITKRTLDHYRERGLLPYSRIGGKIFYRPGDIGDYLKRHITQKEARQ